MAVANAFDTMCSKTPYKGERSVEDAVAELRRCSGTQFDPDIVEVFVRSLEISGDPLRWLSNGDLYNGQRIAGGK